MIARLTRPSIARAAILPVAGVLTVIAVLAVAVLATHNRARTAASLLEKATLTARVIGPNAAAAAWNFDAQSGARILQALAPDPDFASGIVVDDKGELFASFRNSTAAIAAVTPTAVAALLGAADPKSLKISELREFVEDDAATIVLPLVVEPLIIEQKGLKNVGYMALSFSRRRAHAAALREILAIGTGGILALLAVCALLGWVLSRVTRPIRNITEAMDRLSSGELDTTIPALDRRDEVGAMARALAVFKENSIERQRLEFLTSTLQQTTEDLRREGAMVAHLANHDTMTGLANRASFTGQLNEAFAAARRSGTPFAILCLDLDHFKDVNDTLGHPQGDLILQAAAHRLKGIVHHNDVIGRLGGDEFAVLVTSATDASGIAVLAQRINEALAEPVEIEGNQVGVSASIGISIFAPTIASPDQMMIQADLALYRTKQGGRNGFCFHSSDLDDQVHERVAITGELHAALQAGGLELYYQPQVEIASGRIIGLEALVCWNHPTRGLLSSAAFVPVAEATGMMVPLGRWILDECCRQIRSWSQAGVVPPLVAINVSAAQFKASVNFDHDLVQLLARYGIDPRAVELELTEQTLMDATGTHRGTIERIRALGVGVAIDDFGTGHSSLGCLRSYRVSRLRIAQQLVRELATNPGDAAIVRTTIGLARELGIDVLAEGVETAGQLRLLEAAGCRCVQGTYFSRPVPAAAAAELLCRGVLRPGAGIAEVDGPALAPDDACAA
jgi:diguanylate cyclase (GGDEF)-like protein